MKWIAVSEDAPAAGRRVLFVAPCEGGPRVCLGGRAEGGVWVAESEFDADGNHLRSEAVRHWMPLPETADAAWRSVADELPESWRDVLFVAGFASGPHVCLGYWAGDGARWKDRSDYDRTGEHPDVFTTTHWLPLPELPVD